jgi:glycosyltransferase involved in cell wall biosynthesis
MNNILFTVIIPHYNCLELLLRAVASIPDKSYIEVLVIDNSPEPIDKTLFENKRKNVQILYSSPKRGAGGARNTGLENALGKWLLFSDADDFFAEKAFDAFLEFHNSSFDLVFFKMSSCYSDTMLPAARNSEYAPKIENFLSNLFESEENLRYGFPVPYCKMIKKELIEENAIRFDEVCANNDDMFSLKVGYHAKRISASAETVYCVTVRKGSIVNTMSPQIIEVRLKVILNKNKFLRKYGLDKYQSSVMYLIYQASRFSYKLVAKCLWMTITSGMNLFIGSSRWFSTYISISKHENEIKDYMVKSNN